MKVIEYIQNLVLFKYITVWKEAFSSQDGDSDGLISVGKLETLLKSIGCNPSEEDVQKVISKSNKTGESWNCVFTNIYI